MKNKAKIKIKVINMGPDIGMDIKTEGETKFVLRALIVALANATVKSYEEPLEEKVEKICEVYKDEVKKMKELNCSTNANLPN